MTPLFLLIGGRENRHVRIMIRCGVIAIVCSLLLRTSPDDPDPQFFSKATRIICVRFSKIRFPRTLTLFNSSCPSPLPALRRLPVSQGILMTRWIRRSRDHTVPGYVGSQGFPAIIVTDICPHQDPFLPGQVTTKGRLEIEYGYIHIYMV